MNVYNLSKNEVFNIDKGNSTKNIDFNVDSKDQFAIYDLNNYDNVRPIFKEFMKENSIEPSKDDFNREIELQKIREQNEIMKNYGEISITSDPRITKYSDTYSITPYSDFKVMNTTETDSDIVESLDHCKGEWVNVDRCNPNKPCKRILQEYIIENPNYTGDHCRVDHERVRDGDTRMTYCDEYNSCNGRGRCEGYDICTCDEGYSGPNCDNTCPDTNCNNGVAVPPDCNCICNPGYSGNNCDICDQIDCYNDGTFNSDTCKCNCINGYTGPNCNIPPDKCEHPVKIDCHNGTCIGGTCNCDTGYTGKQCQTKQLCNPNYCGENGVVIGNIPDGCSCKCNYGYSGDTCDIKNVCKPENLRLCKYGTVTGYISEECECKCNVGYSGKNCDTYDCEMFKQELINKNNLPHEEWMGPTAFPFLKFKQGDPPANMEPNDPQFIFSNIKGISFKLSEFNHRNQFERWEHKQDFINYFNKLIDDNYIEKTLQCCTNLEIIVIDTSYTNYFKELEEIIMKIFDRISKYENGKYLSNIIITRADSYNNAFIKIISNISTKYYSEYKGTLRDIASDDYNEFLKSPVVFTGTGFANTLFKANCQLTEKYKKFIKDGIMDVIYNIPLEYFADCIPTN